jgi:hypothetical protein
MEAPSVNCAAMMPALTAYCSCSGAPPWEAHTIDGPTPTPLTPHNRSPLLLRPLVDAFSKVVAVTWVNEFIKLCGVSRVD